MCQYQQSLIWHYQTARGHSQSGDIYCRWQLIYTVCMVNAIFIYIYIYIYIYYDLVLKKVNDSDIIYDNVSLYMTVLCELDRLLLQVVAS